MGNFVTERLVLIRPRAKPAFSSILGTDSEYLFVFPAGSQSVSDRKLIGMLFYRPSQFLRRCRPFCLILFLCGGMAYGQRTVFLVRHAEKSDASTDPTLSVAGEKRASLLVHLLADADVRTIYVTEWKRTQETAAPLARARNLKPIVIPAKEVDLLAEKIRTSPGAVLVIGHSNTLPVVINALGVAETLKISETDYDQLFLVTGESPVQLTRLRY